ELGEAIGGSEDAAQKRVSRALERLRQFFGKRKVTVGASGLAAALSANAIHAAPAELLALVATGAGAASTAISSSTAIALTKTIAMTTLQKTMIVLVVTGGVAVGIYQSHQVSNLRSQVQTLEQQNRQAQQQQAGLSSQLQKIQSERDNAVKQVSALSGQERNPQKNPNEILKLRNEVGRLRQENASIGSTNALSKVTANP